MKIVHKEIKTLVVDNVRTGSEFKRFREERGVALGSVATSPGDIFAGDAQLTSYLDRLERGEAEWNQRLMDSLISIVEKAAKESGK